MPRCDRTRPPDEDLVGRGPELDEPVGGTAGGAGSAGATARSSADGGADALAGARGSAAAEWCGDDACPPLLDRGAGETDRAAGGEDGASAAISPVAPFRFLSILFRFFFGFFFFFFLRNKCSNKPKNWPENAVTAY